MTAPTASGAASARTAEVPEKPVPENTPRRGGPGAGPTGPALRPDPRKNRLGYNIIGLLAFVVMAFPVYWLVLSAFRPNSEIRSYDQSLLPTSLTFDNFVRATETRFFWTAIQSSLIICITSVLGAMIIGTIAAFAIGRFNFIGRRPFMMVLIIVQVLPPTAMLIPIYVQLNAMGALNEYWGVIVVYLVSVLPFSIWMIRGFVINVPKELEESAMVDGCGRMGAFWRVIFPLLAPGLAAASIFALITAWNEYLFAYVIMQDNDKYTLNVWLMNFTTDRGTDYGGLMAGSVIVALPVVIFFMIVQKKMAAGLTSGAVKG